MSWVSRLFGEKKPRSEADVTEAAAAPARAPAGTAADIEVWMGTARQEFREERYAASLSSIEALLETDPRHAPAWQLKGGVLAKLQRFEEAALAVEEYLRLAPDSEADKIQGARSFLRNLRWVNTADDRLDVEGLCGKAVTLHQFGQSAEAVRCLDRALSIDPKSLQAWNDRALALEALGRTEGAIVSYDHALELQPNAAAVWFNRANLLDSMGRGGEALHCYRKFVAISPPELQHMLPDANNSIKRLLRASSPDAIDPAVEKNCEDLRAAPDAAQIALRGKKDLLAAAWQPSLGKEERSSLFASAERAFKEALDLDGNCVVALSGQGQILAKRDSEYQRAVQFYDKAIAIEPENAEAFMLKAASLSDMGRSADALACISIAMAKTRDAVPLKALAHFQRGLLARVTIEELARDRRRSSDSISLRVANVVQFKEWLLGHGFHVLGPEDGFAARPMLVWISDNLGSSIGEWTESRDGAVSVERVVKPGAGESRRELGWAQLCQRLEV